MFVVKELGKKYVTESGEKWALRNISFSLPKKGLVAVKGESGSGKSTLLNLLATLEKPSEGKVLFNGKDLFSYKGKEQENIRNFEFGFLYQHFNLLEGETSLENVMMPLLVRGLSEKEAKKRAESLFEEFMIAGLENKKCSLLSGGEKQRVALLRVLIAEPSVIFADEPTGALDKKNENLVMETLKSLSNNHLVIFVSHNERLISAYAERIITLRDGTLSNDSKALQEVENGALKKDSRGPKRKWMKRLLLGNFEKNLGKNLLSFLSGAICFSSLLISASFVFGSEKSLNSEKKKTLLYYQASLSEKISYPIAGSPLKLSKNERPSLEVAGRIFRSNPNISIENDYSYFLPTYGSAFLDGEAIDPISFNPVFDLTLSELGSEILIDGNAPKKNDFSTCVINTQMAGLFSFSLIGKTISVLKQISVSNFDATDELVFAYDFVVSGVVKEFTFLNTPRVYYSYPAARDFFRGFPLPKISQAAGRDISVDQLLTEALGDESFASFDFLCFAHSDNEAEALRTVGDRLIETKSSCSVSNSAYEIEQGFTSLRNAITGSLIPFLVIEGLSSAFIIGALSYSTFLEHRKEAAILLAMGAKKKDVSWLYLLESLFVAVFSAVFALALVPLLEKALNPLLNAKTGIPNLLFLPYDELFGIPFLVIGASLLLSSILSILGAGLPLAIVQKRPMAESLRDE